MMPLALQQAAPPFYDLSSNMDMLGAWLVCFFTLSVYSFLYRDNPFYKTAEHVFVGAGTAFFALEYYEQGIKGAIWEHIDHAHDASLAGEMFELGGYAVDPWTAIVFRLIAAVLGVFLLTRIFWPNSWMARWPLAIMVGVYAALKMTGETQSKLVLQFKGAIKPWATTDSGLSGGEAFWQNLSYAILLVGMICALLHFVFTFKRGKAMGGISRVGIITLMITFGSMFGFTVLGRYALLIERLDTLAGFTAPGYSLVSSAGATGGGGVSVMLSPPWIVAGILVLGLLIMKSMDHSDDPSTS